jgi:hypothetical protein
MDPKVRTRACIAVSVKIGLWTDSAVLAALPATTLSTPAQSRTFSFSLKPRQPLTLPLSVRKDQVAHVHLHRNGGIIGVREITGDRRPLWFTGLGHEQTGVISLPGRLLKAAM